MTCATCALRIERILGRQDGVSEAVVNFTGMEARAVVAADTDVVAPRQPSTGSVMRSRRSSRAMKENGRPPDTPGRSSTNDASSSSPAALTTPLMVLSMLVAESDTTRIWQATLSTPVVFIFGAQFHRIALKRLRGLEASMDTLISVGALSAWTYSVFALFTDQPVFFETAGMIVSLILLGRFFEARAKGRGLECRHQAPPARCQPGAPTQGGRADHGRPLGPRPWRYRGRAGRREDTDRWCDICRAVVHRREHAHRRVVPVDREVGDDVYGATINQQGRLEITVTHVGPNTALAQIVRLIEEAQATKAPIQKLADQVSSIFVPAVDLDCAHCLLRLACRYG